jgi:large subunit ribosomal protein L16
VRLGLGVIDIAAQRVQRNAALAVPFGPGDLRPAETAGAGDPDPFGAFGLKAMEPERITARQIEAARRAITRHIKRSGRLWIRIFPDVPVSSKPAEVRMGSGKGSPEFWVARVKPGRILFELDGVPGSLAKTAFERAAEKLPIKTKVVARLGESLVEEEK